jgi:2-amino-4-hydroxy-6-hydroxymethyldihydropteridine diphosphokinase
MMRTVAFGLGGNLGDAAAALRGAVAALEESPDLQVRAVSSLYRTVPVGGPDQPEYRNAVVVARSAAAPHRLLALAQQIEQAHGRTREVRWGPRTLDVDVLAVGELTSDDPDLTLPHPRAHVRGFVLVPWAEVDPGFVVVGHGRVEALCAHLPDSERAGVVRLPDIRWPAGTVIAS